MYYNIYLYISDRGNRIAPYVAQGNARMNVLLPNETENLPLAGLFEEVASLHVQRGILWVGHKLKW